MDIHLPNNLKTWSSLPADSDEDYQYQTITRLPKVPVAHDLPSNKKLISSNIILDACKINFFRRTIEEELYQKHLK
jgi:hypothetical protein